VHNLFGLAHYISLEGLRTEVENDKGRYHTLTDMAFEQPFSKRNRYSGAAKEITIREDAPENLRYVVLQTAVDLGWAPSSLRTIICLRAACAAGRQQESRGQTERSLVRYA
jgi:hypothetical protein